MNMANFISWSDELIKWRNALASRNPDHYFMAGHENKQQMRVTYKSLGSVQAFTEWLESKAAMESEGYDQGALLSSVGGS
jgi:hypothetical protein